MKLLIALVIIAIISLVGARISFFNRRLPMGVRSILLTGTEYIFVGALLGHLGAGLLDKSTLTQLEPFLLFCLCWVGFLFGLQFEIKQIKKLPLYYFTITAVQAFVAFVIVAPPVYFLLSAFVTLPESLLLMMAVTLGSTASSTAQTTLAIISRNYKIRNKQLMDLLRYMAGVDGMFALGFFTLAICFFSWGDLSHLSILLSLKWLAILLMVGLIPALVLIFLNRSQFSQQEFLMFLIGVNMFCAGLAHTTQHPPLIAGFICGVLIANYCKHRLRALTVVLHAEKTIYIALLILVGASWHSVSAYSLIIAAAYILLKILGKFIGVYLATTKFKSQYHIPKTLGFAMISEGGLAVAIIINFKLMFPEVADSLVSIVLLAVIVCELLSPKLIMSQFSGKDALILKKEGAAKAALK